MSSRSSRRPQRSPADDAHAHGGGCGDRKGGNAEQVSQPRPRMAVAVPALPESAARRRRTSSGSGGSGSDADSKHASFEPPASTSSGASARRGRGRSRSRSITRNNENDDKERVDQRVVDVAVAGAGTAAEAASPMHTQVATSSASAPPIVTVEVTRTTRRQTFGETAIPTERGSVVGGKKSSSGAGTSAAARTGRALVVHQGAIANTRSSSSEDSTSGMLDLFSPPMPSAEARDRSRSRSTSRSRSSRPAEVDLAAAVTASASVEDTAGVGYHADHQQQQQQRGYGNVVHLPKQREGAATAIVAGSGRAADAIERNPGVDFHYDSNESADFNAALQLTFDESPENSPRDSEREELKQESRAGVSSGQHHSRHGEHQDRSRESEGYDSQQHQQQQYHYPPGAPGYYSHPPHQQHQQGSGSWPATAQGYPQQQYPPSSPANVSAAQQGEVAPGYPPPPPPPPGYQWAPAAAGQQPPQRGGQPYQPPGGYYYPHQPPPAHQAQHYHPGMPPPAPHPMTPSSARTPASKRKGRNLNVNTTMETAELSYDQPDDGELRVVGPVSPPSSKKKRSGTAWGSPPRGSLDQEATPQRGSTYASRRRSEQDRSQPSPYHQQTGTPHSLQQSHELRPTGGAELFPTESWSPSAMGAFFDEDSNLGSTAPAPAPFAATSGGSDVARADHTLSQYPHRDAPNMPPFVSAMSPTRGGITIRGSPISRANRPQPVATPVRQPEEAHETPSRDTQFPQQYQSSWQTPSSAKTSASMRIKIGGVGMESTREIEGINSVLRGSPVETPYKHPPHGGGLQPYQPHMKMDYAPTSGQRSVAMMTPAASAARQGTGKENSDNGPSTFKGSTQPCNCKKSKCLKLYCECFAAEKFCMGCKCLDCHNTPAFESIRNKAIADTKAKNPNAFKEKMTQNSSHAVGCKCKRSACLKKYCECFQAGIVCGAKCKCVNCKNFVGSQALIDRRRKIKDHKGAEIAMKSSEKAWKGSLSDTKVGLRTTGTLGQSPIVHDPTRAQSKTTNWSIMSPLAAYSPAHQPPPGRPQHEYPPGFGYSPYHHAAGMPQQSPMVYHVPHPPPPYSAGRVEGLVKTPMTPSAPQGYPRSPGRRVKRLTPPKEIEAKVEYFGPDVAAVTKSAALKIFAYLNNDELFCASVVSKKWCDVAFDKEGKGVFGLDAQSTLA